MTRFVHRPPAAHYGLIGPAGGPGHQGSDDTYTDAEALVILATRPGTHAMIRRLQAQAVATEDARRARGLVQEAEAWARTLEGFR
jgi:hypothetical protein